MTASQSGIKVVARGQLALGMDVPPKARRTVTPSNGRGKSIPGGLSSETLAWLSATSVSERKARGQYMTPALLRDRLLSKLDLWPGMRVLDPGVGTGEFLRDVLDREPTAEVVGWDVDPRVLEHAARLVPEAHLEVRSALDGYAGDPFDLVIGNPPFFQFKASLDLKRRFAEVISGRPNIFALFFQAGLEALAYQGQLAYVAPTSLNNGAYFQGLRRYLTKASGVESLEIVDDHFAFADAQSPVELLVLRKGLVGDLHVFRRSDPRTGFERLVFTPDPELLASEFEGRRTLSELGYEAVTGSIVWNQHRDRLRTNPDFETVPLIWAHNVQEDGIVLRPNEPKDPQYVVSSMALTGPAVVVNRIVGAVGSGSLRAALIPKGFRFLGENHVNTIRVRHGARPQVGWADLVRALLDKDVSRRIRLLTGNSQLSATELTNLLPLDL